MICLVSDSLDSCYCFSASFPILPMLLSQVVPFNFLMHGLYYLLFIIIFSDSNMILFLNCLNQLGEFPMDCPLHDSLLHVHYKGMLPDEEKRVFYDTRVDNNGQPLEFSSGEGLVSAMEN